MPTFAAVLAPFERVVTNAAFRRLERTAATVPFTEKWTGWDLNPEHQPGHGQQIGESSSIRA